MVTYTMVNGYRGSKMDEEPISMLQLGWSTVENGKMVKKMRVKIYDVLCIKNIFDTVFRYDLGASGVAPVPVTQNSSASSAPAILVVYLVNVGSCAGIL